MTGTSSGETAAGLVVAQTGAAAADLVCAAARDVASGTISAQAAALAARLRRLGETDLVAFERARAALRGSAAAASRDERRDFALGRALDEAAAVPLAIAEACADVVALAEAFVGSAAPHSVADVAAAAFLARGAARAAAHLVSVNLAVARDDERAVRARAAAGQDADLG